MPSDSHIQCESEDPDAVSRILRATAETCSRWFLAMRCCIRRERVRQQLFREENGLPRGAKLPYEPQPLTSSEEAIAISSEAIIRAMFGDATADYARDKFRHAISTGDMRSFKIRLVILKARDSLAGTVMHRLFSMSVDNCISQAEILAGCKPDPTPRRLSKAEQEKKRLRDEALSLRDRNQMKLQLVWPEETQTRENTECQDIELHDVLKTQESADYFSSAEDKDDKESVTVTHIKINGERYGNAKQSKKERNQRKEKVVRKSRDYDSVDEILQDIEDGAIVPYDSMDEILADLKSGDISEVEAFMFATALEQYNPSDEHELERECEEAEQRYEEDEDGDIGEDDEDFNRQEPDRGQHTSFSYNPRGFAGCDYARGDEEW